MKWVRVLAWAWIIIIGGLMITPGGVECIVCGRLLNTVVAVISVLLGAVGLYGEFKGATAGK